MVSRGYNGRLPTPPGLVAAGPAQWLAASTVPLAATVIALGTVLW
jgi:hypothetical protein